VKSYWLSVLGALALTGSVGVGEVRAQPALPGGGPPMPAYSPYLNLLRPGGTAAQNYYQLVQPELSWRQGQYNLQNQVAGNQQSINDLRNDQNQSPTQSQIGGTGHAATFMNYRSFFMNNATGGGGGGGRR